MKWHFFEGKFQTFLWVRLFFLNCTLGSRVHVQIMQDCCIGTYMTRWFAVFIPPSPISRVSPLIIPSHPPHPAVPPLAPHYWLQCLILPSLCPCVLIIQYPPMSDNIWCLVFCSSVSLLRMMISRFIHVPMKDINSLFFMAVQYSMVYMCHIFFVQSIINGHLGWFQVFAIVNSAAMNIRVHVSL